MARLDFRFRNQLWPDLRLMSVSYGDFQAAVADLAAHCDAMYALDRGIAEFATAQPFDQHKLQFNDLPAVRRQIDRLKRSDP